MNFLSGGGKPDGKEPDPKRRRTRRPGNRVKRDGHSAHVTDNESAIDAKRDSRVNVEQEDVDRDNGSRTPTRNGRTKRHGQHTYQSTSAQNDGFRADNAPANGSGEIGSIVDTSLPSREKPEQKSENGNLSGRGRSGKWRKRKRGNSRRHFQGNGELRNVRAMPKRVADASYDPVVGSEEATRAKPHHHTAKNSGRQSGGARAYQQQGAPVYAALDLGTNNCRLLIAKPQEKGRFRVIDGFSRIVRLGEGLEQSGKLSDDAMDRAVEALKVCARKLSQKNIRKQRLIATEACRQAMNGEVFLDRVKRETGLELEIVDRETEARLAAEGCGSLMDKNADGAVLFDIGGGSSELILVDSSDRAKGRNRNIADKIVSWTSLPMGVVTLAERFGGRDVSRQVFDEMVREVTDHINAFDGRDALAGVFRTGQVHLLGTSGTVTTLAGIHLELPRYDRRRVDGIWLKDTEVDKVISRLLDMSFPERASNPCIGEERADLVLAGCAILNAIRQFWPTTRLRVADRGLREGLLAEMMHSDQVWMKRHRDRRHHGRRHNGHHKTDKQNNQS